MGGGSQSQSSQGSGGGWGQSSSSIVVPEALKPLYQQTADYTQQMQNMLPMWGASTTQLKEGASPTGVQYPWIAGTPGSPAVPASSSPQIYVDPQTGQVYSGDAVKPVETAGGGQAYQAPSTGIDPLTGMPLPGPYVFATGGVSTPAQAAVPGTPGYYDYSAEPEFIYSPEDYETVFTSPNFLEANPMAVAGESPLQQWAGENVTSLANTPLTEQLAAEYAVLAPYAAGRMATGAGVGTDPGVLAASEAFEDLMAPAIQNQMGLAGLGKSSSLANSLALAKSQYMLPLVQDYLAREQTALQSQAQMYGAMVPQLGTLGMQETSRLSQALTQAEQMGGTRRSIEQEANVANYQDFLRQQALAEEALFPYKDILTASIGPASQSQYYNQYQQTGSGSASSGLK